METVLRITIIYVFLMIGLRAVGKRELSQLSPMDLVTLLLIPEITQQAMMQEDFSLTNALIGVSTLLVLVFLNSVLSYRSKKAQRVMEGTPTVLVSQSQFVVDAMNKERVGPDEIYSEMHQSGLSRLEQVQWAILETDGTISIIPYRDKERVVESPRQKGVVG